jgi:Dolichyl-phosphate-mannose-protein mannosyltransferase
LEGARTVLQSEIEGHGDSPRHARSFRATQSRLKYAIYPLALAISISIWFIAIRAPLWLDETVSYWQVDAGFWGISSRQGLSFPAYSYILWLNTLILGKSEVMLRVPEILAMLGAVYLLYRAARELFEWDVAMIAAVVFCLHPFVIFESIDVRPYAFGALAITASILALVQLRHNPSSRLAGMFGLSAACILYFHFLFVVILPALAVCFFARNLDDRKAFWRQAGVALLCFAIAFLPVVPGMEYMFHTSNTHAFAPAPSLSQLGQTFTSIRLAVIFLLTIVAAAVTRRLDLKSHLDGWPTLLCVSSALVPILTLYAVSVGTSIHVFEFRYRLVAVPGVALCWALAISRIRSRNLRLLFCAMVVATTAYHYFTDPIFRIHGYTWKYALEFAEKNASPDNAPVLICSDFPESNSMPMPIGSAVRDSAIFAPLSYYQLSVPLVALPRALNEEAMRVGSRFLQDAVQRHKRFLALAFVPSYGTLDWIANHASGVQVRELGVFDGIKVLEFDPRTSANTSP